MIISLKKDCFDSKASTGCLAILLASLTLKNTQTNAKLLCKYGF